MAFIALSCLKVSTIESIKNLFKKYSLIQTVLFKLYQILYLTSTKIKYKLPISDVPETCVELDKNKLFILFNQSSEFLFD